MKKLPIGIQTFSELIENDYVYVDKTRLIYHLISTGKYYFFARPRRFGKSLLVSTLANIFSGNKSLFAAFAINALPYDWKQYPVIKISLSDMPCTTPQELIRGLKLFLQNIAQQHQINVDIELSPGEMLQKIVVALSQKEHVVILVDEYDYPILKHIHNMAVAEEMREVLKNFYIVIKGLDQYLKFVFLTGVSKFSKTSIFSGLNNLNDISLDDSYNELLGYTYNEIVTNFQPYLQGAAHYNNCSIEDLLAQITEWYDGYFFAHKMDATKKMYNPYSVLLFLSQKNFSNYWFTTGTPIFLINLLKSKQYPLQDFEAIQATQSELSQFEIENIYLKLIMLPWLLQ